MNMKEHWNKSAPFLKFLYGLLVGMLLIILYFGVKEKEQSGLRINNTYIKSISGQEAYVNDVYVTTMVNFADKCGGNQSFYRFSDNKGRLYGITLWCKHNQQSFTFFYSDKWRENQYGKK